MNVNIFEKGGSSNHGDSKYYHQRPASQRAGRKHHSAGCTAGGDRHPDAVRSSGVDSDWRLPNMSCGGYRAANFNHGMHVSNHRRDGGPDRIAAGCNGAEIDP